MKKIISDHNALSTASKILNALESGDKVIHVENGPIEEIEQFYTSVAIVLGELAPMEEDSLGNKTGVIYTHIKHPWPEPSQSYSHSQTRQPFHTDGSYESNAPQITYFCCKKQAEFGGATIFIEIEDLEAALQLYDADLLKDLKTTELIFSKGKDYKTKPIINNGKLTWNWHRCNELPIAKRFHEFMESKIFDGGVYNSVNLKEGEALFFMDEEVLHGRQSFIGSRWLINGGIYYERKSCS